MLSQQHLSGTKSLSGVTHMTITCWPDQRNYIHHINNALRICNWKLGWSFTSKTVFFTAYNWCEPCRYHGFVYLLAVLACRRWLCWWSKSEFDRAVLESYKRLSLWIHSFTWYNSWFEQACESTFCRGTFYVRHFQHFPEVRVICLYSSGYSTY